MLARIQRPTKKCSGGSRGTFKTMRTYFFYNFVFEVCFVNIDIQYSLTKYGFWSASEVI